MALDCNDLHEELLAVLAAHRELDGNADEELVAGLMERIAHQSPQRARHADLRAAYDALIPVKPSTVVAIAIAQGVVILSLGEFLLHRFFDYYYGGYGASGLIPSLTTLGVIWIAEVIVTVAAIAALVPRVESDRSTRHRGRSARRPSSLG